MIRKIIRIDEDKCDGCGLCAQACHEGAIGMVGGKAKLLRDDYCDGLGDCLPVCPTDAISFVEREAAPYDKEAAEAAMRAANEEAASPALVCGCPGTHARALTPHAPAASRSEDTTSQLRQWPVQIQLVPPNAPYFNGAHLLVAADCAAYAHGAFHSTYMRNKVTIIGCPKLDDADYAEKLTAIIAGNEIKSVTVVRMEVPCCGGIEHAVKQALINSGKMIPWRVVTLSTEGTELVG